MDNLIGKWKCRIFTSFGPLYLWSNSYHPALVDNSGKAFWLQFDEFHIIKIRGRTQAWCGTPWMILLPKLNLLYSSSQQLPQHLFREISAHGLSTSVRFIRVVLFPCTRARMRNSSSGCLQFSGTGSQVSWKEHSRPAGGPGLLVLSAISHLNSATKKCLIFHEGLGSLPLPSPLLLLLQCLILDWDVLYMYLVWRKKKKCNS